MLFNMAANSVVRNWLFLMVEYGAVLYDRLRHAVGRSLGFFYVDDGILGSWDPEWLKGTLNVLLGILRQIGLADNVTNRNTMTLQLV